MQIFLLNPCSSKVSDRWSGSKKFSHWWVENCSNRQTILLWITCQYLCITMTREVKLKAREVRCDKSARGQRAQPVPSSPVNRAQAPFRAAATSARDTLERTHTNPRPLSYVKLDRTSAVHLYREVNVSIWVALPGALTSEKGPRRFDRSIAQVRLIIII